MQYIMRQNSNYPECKKTLCIHVILREQFLYNTGICVFVN